MSRPHLTTVPLKIPLTAVLLACCLTPARQATAHTPSEGDIWATVGPMAYRTVTTAAIGSDSPYTGGGIVAEGDVDYNGGVEIAMLYIDKIYVRRRDEDVVAERIKRMYITTGYRHWFAPWASAAAAFFSSYSMGDPATVVDERSSSDELKTVARDITEYGMDFSLQWEIWSNGTIGLVADARYSWSLSKRSREDADLYGLLLGFKYLVPKQGS